MWIFLFFTELLGHKIKLKYNEIRKSLFYERMLVQILLDCIKNDLSGVDGGLRVNNKTIFNVSINVL